MRLNRPLNICFVTQQYGKVRSGIGIHSRLMVNGLIKRGHKVTVICPNKNVRQKKGIRFIFVKKSGLDPTAGSWLSLSYRFSKEINKLQKREKFDIIHFTDAREALFCSKETPIVGNMNDVYYAMASKNPFFYKKYYYYDWIKRYFYYNLVRFLEKKALRKLSAIICNSRFVKLTLNKKYNLPNNKLHVVCKSIDPSRFTKKSRIKKGNFPVILFVGGNYQRKGLPLIIKASPKIIEKYPSAKFYVVGEDPNENKMKKLCEKQGVKSNFVFLGFVPNERLINYYKIADIFVMPSLVEAFGVVFLEAMACAVPVMGSKIGGTKELIKDGVNGFLVNPYDAEQLSKKMLEILENKKLRNKFVQAGKKTVKKFNKEVMVKKTLSIYKLILKR